LLPRDGGWWAGLTDVAGITAAVREHDVRPASVTILGAGGTAQAALAALADWDLTECHVLVRDSTRTAQLQATAQRLGVRLEVLPLEVTSIALDADLIISTLPRDAADQLASREWQPGQALLDAVYDPWPTVLAEAAQRGGVSVISGALMLLHQAAAQVELMTTRPAPLAAMRAALASAAPGCGV
jgi:shikimate dehydrogenase